MGVLVGLLEVTVLQASAEKNMKSYRYRGAEISLLDLLTSKFHFQFEFADYSSHIPLVVGSCRSIHSF